MIWRRSRTAGAPHIVLVTLGALFVGDIFTLSGVESQQSHLLVEVCQNAVTTPGLIAKLCVGWTRNLQNYLLSLGGHDHCGWHETLPALPFCRASPKIFRVLNVPAQIKGMEEGIHSMRVGGKRRVIMPQGLGYTVQGLGPYPADPRKRDVLVQVNITRHLLTLPPGAAHVSTAFRCIIHTAAHLTHTLNPHANQLTTLMPNTR